jgi:hypothetical protein
MGGITSAVGLVLSSEVMSLTRFVCRVGADAMVHLLTETSIFVSLPNECLCQLTGEHMHMTAPLAEPSRPPVVLKDSAHPPNKRKSPGAHVDEKALKLQKSLARTDSWFINGVSAANESSKDIAKYSTSRNANS